MNLREMAEFAAWLNARWPSRPRDEQWVRAWHADFEHVDQDTAMTAARTVAPQGLAPEGHELLVAALAEKRKRRDAQHQLEAASEPEDGCSWEDFKRLCADEIPPAALAMIDAGQRRNRAEVSNERLLADDQRRRGVTADRRRDAVGDLQPVGS